MKVEAIILEEHGGPEQLRSQLIDVPDPSAGEILVEHEAIAVNFHDCYVRTGLYRTLTLPGIPGLEAVGVVTKAGPGVSRFAVGDRVGWITPEYGGYAAKRVLPATKAFKIPGGLSPEQAAASVMKAMTVRMLIRSVYPVQRGQTVLVHAAAGGVGQLLTQWCHHAGATVIATVGDTQKAEIARACGASHIVHYKEEDFVDRVHRITDGHGVPAVFDSVGADTTTRSLQCLDFRGTLINYGQSSGAAPPIEFSALAERSLSVSRPILFHYIGTTAMLDDMAEDVFAAFEAGILKPISPMKFSLAQASDAHRLIEARSSPGGIVLRPGGP